MQRVLMWQDVFWTPENDTLEKVLQDVLSDTTKLKNHRWDFSLQDVFIYICKPKICCSDFSLQDVLSSCAKLKNVIRDLYSKMCFC